MDVAAPGWGDLLPLIWMRDQGQPSQKEMLSAALATEGKGGLMAGEKLMVGTAWGSDGFFKSSLMAVVTLKWISRNKVGLDLHWEQTARSKGEQGQLS